MNVLTSATAIPAGNYIVHATISAQHSATPGNWGCNVTIGGVAVVTNTAAAAPFQTLTLVGGINVGVAGTPLIRCQSTANNAVVVSDVAFSVIQVTTQTALP